MSGGGRGFWMERMMHGVGANREILNPQTHRVGVLNIGAKPPGDPPGPTPPGRWRGRGAGSAAHGRRPLNGGETAEAWTKTLKSER
jgi:hypothetical protein